ncbi:MAG: hypothetical protein LH470_01115 [Lysobacter sp.]|nr:hypothetical protein [Lysobacter sp.]
METSLQPPPQGSQMNSQKNTSFSVLEYMYRDAANWKTPGQVLLTGAFQQSYVDLIVPELDGGRCFIAEQIGIPPLQDQHLEFYEPIEDEDLDHAYHEFVALRAAEPDELEKLIVVGDVAEVVARIRAVANRWDCTLSPYGRW